MTEIRKSYFYILESATMFQRCIKLSFRNLDSFITSIILPAVMMVLFVYVFGGAMDVGNYSYINYIVPGIIIQCVGQCAAITAVSINQDMSNGIIARFRSMPIAKTTVMIGHVLAASMRNIITTTIVIVISVLMGFRPKASFIDWLIIIGILILFILVITWLSVIFGLITKSAESASSISVLTIVLPYLSSGFVPTETMPKGLRFFAEHQPMTPIIDTIRALIINEEPGRDLLTAVIWCVALLCITFFVAVNIFRNKKM